MNNKLIAGFLIGIVATVMAFAGFWAFSKWTANSQAQNQSHEKSDSPKILFYRNPMDPTITSPVFKKDSMGMDYIPVYETKASETQSEVPDRGVVIMTTEHQQLTGIKTTEVRTRPLELTMRSTGEVAYDPDLYGLIREYQEAVQSRTSMSGSTEEIRFQSESLVKSALLKLKIRGWSASDIVRFFPTSGSAESLILPDKSAWIYAQVFGESKGSIRPGTSVTIRSPLLQDRQIQGVVVNGDPVTMADTRTQLLRIYAPALAGQIPAKSFVQITFQIQREASLTVPESAVVFSGNQTLIYIKTGKGNFEPTRVKVGALTEGYYPVLEGVKAGDLVVSEGNFLIDSESRIQGANRAGEASDD